MSDKEYNKIALQELIEKFQNKINDMEEMNKTTKPGPFAIRMMNDFKIELRELKFRQLLDE